MKSTQALQTTARARLRPYLKPLLALASLALVVSLTGCGKPVPAYWPDLTVDGDVVYVAEANGQVFALQAGDLSILWAYPLIEKRQGGLLGGCSAQGPSDGPFHAAPAVSGDYIFLGSAGAQERSLWGKGENKSGLRVLSKAGTVQWEYRGTSDRTVAPPALAEGTVYLPSSDHNVYAIDIETRDTRWVFETENWVWATPLVVEDTVFIASMDHILYAVDSQSGNEVWRFAESQSALPAAPAYAESTLYLGSLDGNIYAVDAKTGASQWRYKVDGSVWAAPLIQDDMLYFGTISGKIYALSTANGKEVWQASVGGQVRGTPAYVNGILYFGCEDGRLYAFKAQDGRQATSPLGRQLEKASIYTSPVYDGQHLYIVATDGQVYALDLEQNTVRETNPFNQED